MTSYLRTFIASVADVPAELHRKFRLMRELDERTHQLEKQVDEDCLQQLKELAEKQQGDTLQSPNKRQRVSSAGAAATGGSAATGELQDRIERNTNELIKLSEEKVQLAHQIYDYVDRHIQKLDKELKAFDAEIDKERVRLGLPPTQPPPGTQPADDGRQKKKAGVAEDSTVSAPAPDSYEAALALAGPDEPTYCHCNRISFGEMIGCDNDDCSVEWFHLACVCLTPDTKPKGKWYCKDCRKKLGIKK
ncbi:hypothetical protein N2152v2_011064 [Parachlorella kessleri]